MGWVIIPSHPASCSLRGSLALKIGEARPQCCGPNRGKYRGGAAGRAGLWPTPCCLQIEIDATRYPHGTSVPLERTDRAPRTNRVGPFDLFSNWLNRVYSSSQLDGRKSSPLAAHPLSRWFCSLKSIQSSECRIICFRIKFHNIGLFSLIQLKLAYAKRLH